MRATLIYGAGDVRVENVPDPAIQQPTDAVVRVLDACICGSDLWPYGSMPASEHANRIGHEFLGVVEDVGSDVSGLKAGDLVVAPFVWADNTCDFCTEGLQTSCRHGGFSRVGKPGKLYPQSTPQPGPTPLAGRPRAALVESPSGGPKRCAWPISTASAARAATCCSAR